ncbi:MAG: bifunctional diaminohydroxyphosphoribosylaminopyrimidine deaminase/5-amino-6-(5-phosphoribosylamino)uracil reductase RibD [Proteobacteria bacterium]|nr:bifunctional diaminohydroxyphosphoribosylaminopyrimidine deaminase/5-amino-6-(5-phosphoribosylamino)uracil reductase RibD [Pseudomonadota bacterium]
MITPQDKKYMDLALRLARRADGMTNPNPRVGAVVVRAGRIVGKGYHRRAGTPHAEIHALKEAGKKARGATLYVTLEPCAHQGRTGPCTETIPAAGIRRVVAGMRDPNPLVSGRGLARLRKHGIRIESGVQEKACRSLNEDYAKFITTGLPFVTFKAAASLDGRVATGTGESRWISGEASRRLVHRLRAKSDAILVGIGTIRKDDPELTSRPGQKTGGKPLRVVMDSRLRIPLNARVLGPPLSAPTLIATTKKSPPGKRELLRRRGIEVIVLPEKQGKVDPRALLRVLGKRGVMSLLLESGPELASAFLREKLIDKFLIFLAPKLIGGKLAPGILAGAGIASLKAAIPVRDRKIQVVGEDLLITAYPVYS